MRNDRDARNGRNGPDDQDGRGRNDDHLDRARSPSFEPRDVPVVPDLDPLRPIPAERLTLDAIARRFAAPPQWEPEFAGDRIRLVDRAPIDASVLIGLVDGPQGLEVLLTERAEHLHDHAGQVAFPGGRRDPEDRDVFATALREADEEVGIAPHLVDVIGTLPVYLTATAYLVTPVVGVVRQGYTLRIDPSEVAEAFTVPLAFLMDPSRHRRHRVELPAGVRHFYSMPYTVDREGEPREFFIWGATAAMLRNLYRFLAA